MAKVSAIFKTETQLSTSGSELTSVAIYGVTNIVATACFFNSSSSETVTVSIYRHSTASSIADTNLIIEKAIPPRKTWNCIEAQGKVISDGYSFTASASTASLINAECDGVVST